MIWRIVLINPLCSESFLITCIWECQLVSEQDQCRKILEMVSFWYFSWKLLFINFFVRIWGSWIDFLIEFVQDRLLWSSVVFDLELNWVEFLGDFGFFKVFFIKVTVWFEILEIRLFLVYQFKGKLFGNWFLAYWDQFQENWC